MTIRATRATPSVRDILTSLSKPRLVDLGRQYGVAIAKPNGVPKTESVDRLLESKQIVYRDLLEWMRRDELRKVCKDHGLEASSRSRSDLACALLDAHGVQSERPRSLFADADTSGSTPVEGDVVQVRHRQYLVEAVHAPPVPDELTRVDLVCLDDDQQGRELSVLWEFELGARVCNPHEGLGDFRRMDAPRHFAAYLHALKWNSVTATDAKLFQAPFRAGIRLFNHQLIPLQKALALPRANLFVADDVGLGKTIEAGLVLQELQLRQRIRFVLIVCPAAICLQWQREMDRRFGQRFEIYDRAFVSARRRQRGFGVNPWDTHQRFIISYETLRRPEHLEPLLNNLAKRGLKQSMLVLDEAHRVAPASPAGRYATDSKATKLVRHLAPLFENRLFLSATPHNGHSNSFSTLLELLDPQRFTRGVPIEAGSEALKAVMVRRLKRDLQDAALGKFPRRHVVRVALRETNGKLTAEFGAKTRETHELGEAASLPEVELSQLLAEYTVLQKPERGPGKFVFMNLQKRLLSSISAFSRTLQAHIERLSDKWGASVLDTGAAPDAEARNAPSAVVETSVGLLPFGEVSDDAAPDSGERDEPQDARDVDEDAHDRDEEAVAARSTTALAAPSRRARELLVRMRDLARKSQHAPDAKVRAVLHWIRARQCSGAHLGDKRLAACDRAWAKQRLTIFTEYADTKSYLTRTLQGAFDGTDQAEARIKGFHGAMSDAQREDVQREFNGNPERYPVRILLATDAAREGLNLQNHCDSLFHFDIPWNPARLEQRNGRIDRTLQPKDDVYCHYFVYPDRGEDAVLERLVEKVEVIRKELGSLGDVVLQRVEKALLGGIQADTGAALEAQFELQGETGSPLVPSETVRLELESQRQTQADLTREVDEAAHLFERSARSMQFREDLLRDAINVGLELSRAEPLRALRSDELEGEDCAPGQVAYALPQLPASWDRTLDSLRTPQGRDEPDDVWRRRPPQPVVFKPLDTMGEERVHLHLEHPFVKRVLSRFLAQGYGASDLSRVTVIPNPRGGLVRVIAFGRISLFGRGAARLHDQLVSVAAQWLESKGEGHLRPFADGADRRALQTLEETLLAAPGPDCVPQHVVQKLMASARQDFAALWPAVSAEAEAQTHAALQKLQARGNEEAEALVKILQAQKISIQKAQQLSFGFDSATPTETEQLQSEREHMKRRLEAIDRELGSEPDGLRALYRIRLNRLEPVGLVYLWPTTRM